ncbi:MAG: S8 family serine peptidase, partial [Bacteroidales bacterium]|nr:S8 family serine peptidase [Bacteroidales bacterium]
MKSINLKDRIFLNSGLFIRLFLLSLIISFGLFPSALMAQNYDSSHEDHEMGYSSTIYSVTDNGNNSFTIVLQVESNGDYNESWEVLNYYSVEAKPGTYSDMSFMDVSGNVRYKGINKGPKLGGWNKRGFRIASITSNAKHKAAIYRVSYTLSGGLQDQWVMAKVEKAKFEQYFSKKDFEAVLNSNITGIYAMPGGGKISDATNKIGPELTALSVYAGVPVSNDVYEIIHDSITNTFYVVVEFTPVNGQYSTLLSDLTSSFHVVSVIEDIDNQIIAGRIPISLLSGLNSLPSLASARPLYPVKNNSGLITTSQGDISMRSDIARQIFQIPLADGSKRSLSGKGIKIGIISNSYNTKGDANDDVLKFELPGIGIQSDGSELPNPTNPVPVIVKREYPYGRTTDEGRAMMQIIHDIAPGAELIFRTGVLGAVDMVEGIKELAADCDIIVDDITYITQPFFEDGIVARAVDSVADHGVSYFTSAGNFGDKSYSGTFNPGSGTITGISGSPHLFGTNSNGEDYYQSVMVEGGADAQNPAQYAIVLQWEDGSSFNATNTDLDIYLMNENGSGVIGFNRVNTGGYAIEVLPFTVKETTNTNIVIVKASDNTAVVNFKYIVFKGQLTIEEYLSGTSTIVGHANAAGAMTIGAIRYDKTPAFGGTLNIMSYSSVGGQLVNGESRYKPDFTAPNGVNTTVDLGSGDWEGDDDLQPNFFGTSASAPHAAAVAALLMDAKIAYYNASMNPTEVRADLKNSAIGSGIYDPAYGNGFIQADAALLDLANSTPVISDSIQVEGGIPGINPVRITMNGSYLTDASTVYFNGSPVPTDVNLADGTLQADIPVFNDLYPELNAYNPPKEGTNGKDGGFSNTIYFTKKPTIVGTLNSLSKAYGEDMPPANLIFEVYSIDGTSQTLEEAGFTVDQINRIHAIQVQNTADALSNVGTWPYYVSQDEILNPASIAASDTTEMEAFLLANYNFAFVLGDLTISKLDLTITPDDRTIEFGDPIANMTYQFDYDHTSMSAETDSQIQQELNDAYSRSVLTELTVMADNAFYADSTGNALVPNSFYITKTAYANAQAQAYANAQALALANLYPGMTMAELQLNAQALALVNAQALALVNAQALALVNSQALALVNTQALALVNAQALALVNGEPLSNANLNSQALALVNAKTLMNAQALALVNAESFEGGNANAQALALVNAQALALVNSGSDFELNAQALALVNAQALALVNAQALALVNAQALALVNAQALALVNLYPGKMLEDLDEIEFATMNAQALALVNAQALALVNLYPGMEMSELNAQALALVNAQALALVNAQALALVNGGGSDLSLTNAQALALADLYPEVTSVSELNAQALALVNAQALALVNAQALALVNAQALALVNSELTLEDLQLVENAQALALVNAQALALVNGQALALVNAQALALVNTQALALVNAQALALVNLYPGMQMGELNAQALALVNAQALALVNAQALALVNQSEAQVNSESFSDVYNNNEDAIIILTVADIEAMRANNNSIELVSLNILSGNTVTAEGAPHKIAPGAFMAKNFNVHYGLGNLIVNPVPIEFRLDDAVVPYDGKGHQLNVIPSYKERLDKDGNPYVISPASKPYSVSYIDSGNNIVDSLPIDAGVYRVNIQITDPNYVLNSPPTATLTIEQAPVSFVFTNTTQTYNGMALSVGGISIPELSEA